MSSKRWQLVATLVLAFLVGATTSLQAEETNAVELIKQLQRRIDDLEQKVHALEAAKTNLPPSSGLATPSSDVGRNQNPVAQAGAADTGARTQAKEQALPKITIGDQGFSFASGNGNFGIQLKGVLQVDSRTFLNDAGVVGNDGILLRRARPILQGTVFRDFDFLFVPDFGGSTAQIFDAYLNYRYSPELQLQAGRFKSPVGLESLQSDIYTSFNERALPTDLVPGRDLGFELHGDLFGGVASYAAGVFNGVGDARNTGNADFEDGKAFEARVFFQPFRRTSWRPLQAFGFGLGGSYETVQTTNATALPGTTGGTLPGFATIGQQQFFAYNPVAVGGKTPVVLASGEHWRLAPQGYYYFGPFSLLGEYVISDQKVTRTAVAPFLSRRLQNTAWEITGGWVLTGEDATYGNGIVPRRAFNPRQGDWGAVQLVARYSELDIDPAAFPLFADKATSARSAQEWSVGLNWYLNRNFRINGSFSHTEFDGAGTRSSTAPGIISLKDENVIFTRMQLSF